MRAVSNRSNYLGGSLSEAPVTVGLLIATVLVFALMEIAGSTTSNVDLYRWGAKYGPAIADGEWWRLVIPIFIHIGFFHLFTNALSLLIFGGIVERVFGGIAYLCIYIVTGIIGNLASFVAGPTLGAGASGAIFGIVGAFTVYVILNRRTMGEMGRQALLTMGFIIALNLVLGFTSSGIDNWAHIGGLLSGTVMGYLISPRQKLVLHQGAANFGLARMSLQTRVPSRWWLALAVTIGLAVAAFGVYVKSQSYPYADQFKAVGYHFMDFTDPTGGFRRFN